MYRTRSRHEEIGWIVALADGSVGLYDTDLSQLPGVHEQESVAAHRVVAPAGPDRLANRLLKDPAAHVAVEMHEAALSVLEVNRAMNLSCFRILAHTLTYDGEAVASADARSSPSSPPPEGSRWDPGQRLLLACAPTRGPVRTVVDAYGFDEFNLVMDIEGAEMSLLDNEFELVRDRVASVSVELHPHVLGVDGAARVVRRLMEADLELTAVGEGSVIGLRRV